MATQQQPVGSPFGYRSTAREVVAGRDLAGKRVVVTGGYSGIGTETVRALAGAGAEVLVGARRVEQVAMGWIDAEGTVNDRFKTEEQGAATTVWAATSPLLEGAGGVYCENCEVAVPASPENRAGGVQPHVRDEALAERLWAESERMTGVEFRL